MDQQADDRAFTQPLPVCGTAWVIGYQGVRPFPGEAAGAEEWEEWQAGFSQFIANNPPDLANPALGHSPDDVVNSWDQAARRTSEGESRYDPDAPR